MDVVAVLGAMGAALGAVFVGMRVFVNDVFDRLSPHIERWEKREAKEASTWQAAALEIGETAEGVNDLRRELQQLRKEIQHCQQQLTMLRKAQQTAYRRWLEADAILPDPVLIEAAATVLENGQG